LSGQGTHFLTVSEIERGWWIADASGQVLGRLATVVASRLRGKHKPTFTPFMDAGDFVVVVNADKIRLTGRKADTKTYFNYSGYPGGMRRRTAAERLDRDPQEMIREAVEGMLPHNRLGRRLITKLKVYRGPDHPHAAQQPRPLELRSKTKRGGN
jgi:large subunit ribosomal protein L13